MDTIIKPLSGLDGFKNIIKSIDTDKNVLVNGVTDSQKNHLIYSILKMQKVPGLIVTYSDIRAMNIISDLNTFGCDKVYLYPAKDLLFYNVDIKSSNIYNSRIKVIKELINNEVDCIVVLSIDSLLDKLMPRYKFEEYIYELSRAQIFDLDTFINKLVSMGYERVDLVTTPGEFAVRGDILDIYAKTQDNPYRIEVFDDRVEDIRVFDVSTQRSVKKLNSVTIYPARELIYDKALLTKAIECMRRDLDIRKNDYEQKGMHEELNNLEISVEMDINCIETETGLNNLDRYIHYFYKDAESILDYMIKDTMIFIDEPKRIIKHKDSILSEFNESIKERILKGRLLKGHDKVIFNYEDVLDKLSRFKNMLFSSFMSNIKDFKIDTNVTLEVTPIPTDGSRLDLLLDSLSYYVKRKYTVVILAGLKSKALKLISLLNDKGIKSTYKNSLEDVDCGLSWVFVTKGYLYEGFEYKESKFAVISFKKESYKRTRSKHKENNNVKKIGGFRELNIGDYVVHNAHGIGVYHGIEQVNADGISKDYLKIEYAGGNILYVSTTQMEQVQKYVGAEKGSLKLNKLGGSDWSKTKARARRAVEIAAKDMISLYARRELSKGFAFSKDLVWQQEFEAKFPFQETLDQLNAIKEVKQDMESSKVMDRLICGDVGYGKTEVALRAAFKAVQDSKQVVCLVPTTVLAQQHYNTFTSRMSDYPITVELLSRFKDKKSQKETIKKMKTGEVDIVIGTHRLISKDVMFKDLGLLIIDEEQRFGVRQKEMLKQLMIDVDVISLSATPIPRTLHMSLSGIRDISILNNPPQDRIPVQTYVMEYDDGFIREAIMREMSRGGQIYYVNNRIENIEISVLKINRLIPEARVGVAHGRMSEIELEEVMFNFIERNIDILICTSIIETGLDIPNVNTIIIRMADKLGLSQLYQLRGRVGRSSVQAYAYLMYNTNTILKEMQEKRLHAIKTFSEFGSGLKIAMRDLELRGAGNLMGSQQHGYMITVGYDMYCKLLSDAIKSLKGEKVDEEFETTVDLSINAYIPDSYIDTEKSKIAAYRSIASISTMSEYIDVAEELEDRYGKLPISVSNLIEVAFLKYIANSIGIVSIVQAGNYINLIFGAQADIQEDKVERVMNNYSSSIRFVVAKTHKLIYRFNSKEERVDFRELRSIIIELR